MKKLFILSLLIASSHNILAKSCPGGGAKISNYSGTKNYFVQSNGLNIDPGESKCAGVAGSFVIRQQCGRETDPNLPIYDIARFDVSAGEQFDIYGHKYYLTVLGSKSKVDIKPKCD